MCTVTFVPFDEGFILTSNRDEDPKRKTTAPKRIVLNNAVTIEAPIDEEKGGTWVALESKTNKAACLLNGAHIRHIRKPPYKKSRGKIVVEAFLNDSFKVFAQSIQLDGVEPFTLVLADGNELIELIWDGIRKELNTPNCSQCHLWSSSTLYSPEEKSKKQDIFETYISKHLISPENLWNLHGDTGNKEFILDRFFVKTVSITQIIAAPTQTGIRYYDRKIPEKGGCLI